MNAHHAPPLAALDLIAPVLFAAVFIVVMSIVRERARQRFNAVLVGGAGAAYLSSGFGVWEFAFCAVITALAYLGLRAYAFIGAAWLLHTGWDALHHFYGDAIVVMVPASSAGCAVMDALIAVWFLAGAPSVLRGPRRERAS
jgi:hypothetical protein